MRAGTILPPGQSGFVGTTGLASGTGSPHLTDQLPLFTAFRHKPAELGLPAVGDAETPRPGVKITRDAYGVPSITGDSADNLWFGAGYAVAQDRLFQLQAFRHATQGRLAEIQGASQLEADLIARRDYYTPAELDQQFAKLSPELQARFKNYTDGINAWMDKARLDPSKLPGEFAAVGLVNPPAWKIRDSITIGVFLARTVPSGDGAELDNLRGLRQLGGGRFDQLLPLRQRGQAATVPKQNGEFPSQPGRTRKDEKRAYKRSRAFVKDLPLPKAGASTAAQTSRPLLAGQLGRQGSKMWAIRGRNIGASLFSGPQLGYSIPELFVEYELHGPGLNVRGATAPGVPVIGLGHNEHIAWGLTSGLSDEDDLYAEQLAGDEGYRFDGRTEKMDCRNEVFEFRPPPSSALDLTSGKVPDLRSGNVTKRICRTRHGPVQERVGGVAYARRYAIWGREIETLEGLAAVNAAASVKDVDKAMDKVTWNENLAAADDQGNIGYWHPGLLQIRPKNWDERLPYPGTGEAEWKGFLPPDKRPQVINPKQGFVANWNNVPSVGWSVGDGPARERISGGFHRGAFLINTVRSAHKAGGGFDQTANVDRITGTIAQQRPLAEKRLRAALKGAKGKAAVVLTTILGWDGSYDRNTGGKVDSGVATWEAFKKAAVDLKLNGYRDAAKPLEGGQSASHQFDFTNLQAYAFARLSPKGYQLAAEQAFDALEKRFSSTDPALWREFRRNYRPSAQGAGRFPQPFPFFDRGTYEQVIELGP